MLTEDTKHRPRPEEAAVAWEFFRHFSRDENGKLVELTGGDEELKWLPLDKESAGLNSGHVVDF